VRLGWRRAVQRRGVLAGLIVASMLFTAPELAKRIRRDKTDYLATAMWLRSNTPVGARIASFDRRIILYADRPRGDNRRGYDYVVRRFAGDDPGWVSRHWYIVHSEPAVRGEARIVVYACPENWGAAIKAWTATSTATQHAAVK